MRARNIKPGFFKNENLVECCFEARLLFAGLWCLADRAGRLEDRPKRIKMELFPADNVDCDSLLNELQKWGFVIRYESNGARFIQVVNFHKHQTPHQKEAPSSIPCPDGYDDGTGHTQDKSSASTRQAQDKSSASTRQAPPDSLIPDSLIPDSLIPDSLIPDSLIPDSKTSCPVPCEHGPEPDTQQDFETGETKTTASQVFIAIPTNKNGEEVPIMESQVTEFSALYPAVDVPGELRKIRAWNLSNPTHRKTRGGVLRHVNAWLSKAQNAPPGNARSPMSAPRSGTVSKVTSKNLEALRIVREMEGRI